MEMLVVLVLVGLLAGMALPNLLRTREAMERREELQSVLARIAALPYHAYNEGKTLVIRSEALPFELPTGWSIEVPEPVTYGFNGYCTGGRVVLIDHEGRRHSLLLSPPTCEPRTVAD